MKNQQKFSFRQISLVQRFRLVIFLIVFVGMLGISNWVGQQIEVNIVRQNGATTALIVNNFIAPSLQEYGQGGVWDATYNQKLTTLLTNTSLGKWVDFFIVRDINGELLFSSDTSVTGISPPTPDELSAAVSGEVLAEISIAEKENSSLLKFSDRLLKVISPVRLVGSDQVFAMIEFYQEVDALEQKIFVSKLQSWLVIGAVMLGVYLLLAFFAGSFNETIERQKEELNMQVIRLSELLKQNQILHERVQQAAASVATLHERLLRRIGSELHDGPAQDLSLALMQIDTVIGIQEAEAIDFPKKRSALEMLASVQSAMQNSLTELRSISGGLSLPHLAGLGPVEMITHAVQAHERRTNTKVILELGELPEQLPMPMKITIYRLIQEALNNSFHHAGGTGQQVRASVEEENIIIRVSDDGSGFDVNEALNLDEHFGLVGMRERVESLGGIFHVDSMPSRGTQISVSLSLTNTGNIYE